MRLESTAVRASVTAAPLAAGLWLLLAESALAGLLIVGNGERLGFDPTGKLNIGYTNRFEVVLSGEQWRTKVIFSANSNYFEEYAFDGSECKGSILKAPPGVDVATLESTNVSWGGIVGRGSYPARASQETKLLWLAYCSRSFFSTNRTHRLSPPWFPNGWKGGDSFYCDVVRLDGTLGFPGSLIFRASDDLWRAETRARGRHKEPPLLLDGFVAGEYEVLATTNFQGASIPIAFQLSRFGAPRLTATTVGKRYLLEQCSVRVSGVSAVEQDDLSPKIYSRGVIYDFRFEEPKYPDLSITWKPVSGTWPSATRPEIPDLVKRAKQEYDMQRRMRWRSTFLRHTASIGVFLVLLATPFLLARMRAGRSNIQRETGTKGT